MGKKKDAKRARRLLEAERLNWRPIDPADLDDAEGFGEFEEVRPEVEGVTWAQRVYLMWLLLCNLQEVIARSNKYSISPFIDQLRRERERLGLPYRQIAAPRRLTECIAIFKNIVEQKDEDQ